MLKFLVLGVVLWQELAKGVSGAVPPAAAAQNPAPPKNNPAINNDVSKGLTLDPNGKYNFHASHQIFYVPASFGSRGLRGLPLNVHEVGREIDSGYAVTNGIGAHKIHRRRLPWNRARKFCTAEGGHLAIIRTDAEEKLLLQMMLDNSVEGAWIGYHDQFEEGDWVTVLDEPLAQTGWSRWSRLFDNPDNLGGNQNCGQLVKNGGGLDDVACGDEKEFICKISIY